MDFLNRVYHVLADYSDTMLFNIGESAVTIGGVLKLIVALLLAIVTSSLLRRAIAKYAAGTPFMEEATAYTLGRILHYIVLFLGLVIGLVMMGIDFTSFAIIAGALGVGVGFGLQSIVSNFVSGLIILFERNMKVGDYIELANSVAGVVREINIRSTRITTLDNLDIIVPNADIIQNNIINWSLQDRIIRVHIPFGVAYGSDKQTVEKAATEAAQRVDFTLSSPDKYLPQVWLVNFGDSSLDFELVVWVDMGKNMRPGAMKASYMWEIETSLAEHGITIPFPQRDLHLKGGFDSVK